MAFRREVNGLLKDRGGETDRLGLVLEVPSRPEEDFYIESTIVGVYDFLMTRTTLRAKGQLTLPDDIRKAARLEEGDLFEAEITADGILLRPQKLIDATQAWFWTPDWQAGEREADADRGAGRIESFNSGDELVRALQSQADARRERASR